MKVILITGASKGIGAACIKEFAKDDNILILNYHTDLENATKLENEINENTKSKCIKIKCDITNVEEIELMVNQIITQFGHIDVLVNNAALEISSEVEDKTKEEFTKVLDTNLIGPFLLSRAVASHMLEQKSGFIINIASNNGIDKYDPATLEYDASKAALINLTHNLAINYAPYINVNAIAPGWVMTEKVKTLNNSLNGMLEQTEKEKILINRFIYPEEVAKLVVHLSENKAINNQVITIDGGCR